MTDIQFVPVTEFDRVRRLNMSDLDRAALYADLCRLNTLSMIAYAGSGHIGSSFSSLDIVTWLFLNEMKTDDGEADGSDDLYFSSKGHDAPGLYAAMIALGKLPADNLLKLRRLGGLPGHPDIATTPQIVTNTGSLGMGISKAKGMLFADRLLGRDRRIFVMTGDGELQEGQIWESLGSAANHKLDKLTVIVDHNKFQSDIYVRETSDLGDLEAKFAAFGWYVARCDGHDFAAFSAALADVGKVKGKPKIIIADTIKGRGVSFMESRNLAPRELYRFHSGAPSPEDYARALDELTLRANHAFDTVGAEPLRLKGEARPARSLPQAPQRIIPAYTEALIAAADADKRIVALDGDLILDTGLIPFREKFPDRFLECGIAEMDMVSQAGGMALQGLVPLVHSFACFLAPRPAEQIFNNASEHTKVIYVASLAGLVPGGPGHSHQSVNDIALHSAIPGMEMAEPCCAAEVAPLLDYLLKGHKGSGYLRLVSIPCDIPYELPADYRAVPGHGVELRPGKDAVIVGYGPVMLPQAYQAAELLKARHGLDVAVVNLPWLNRVNAAWLRKMLEGRRALFTVDNHFVRGGQGRMIAAAVAELGLDRMPILRSFGLTELPACGQNDEVLRAHGLDAESLASAIGETLTGKVAA
ncbi:MAG: transketolase C-terminal domain-containing protein [Pseudorhodoplanes sp.]|uniref:transketolase C-terminal domain-containing protein n=1 Tax=Pseudorhodoplanes sp. TaxID=1934341 RepID=UPI003D13D53A